MATDLTDHHHNRAAHCPHMTGQVCSVCQRLHELERELGILVEYLHADADYFDKMKGRTVALAISDIVIKIRKDKP